MGFDKSVLDLVYKFDGGGIVLYMLITTVVATCLALVMGLEEKLRGRETNLKTHILLAAGSSLLMTISIWAIRIAEGNIDLTSGFVGDNWSYDTSRIAAGVISGMGFLGAGAILKDKFSIRGLSTAATLWVCAALGIACGTGFILEAIIFTLIVLLFIVIHDIIIFSLKKKSPVIILTFERGYPYLEIIKHISERTEIIARNVVLFDSNEIEMSAKIYFAYKTKKQSLEYFSDELKKEDGIVSIKIENI